MERNPGFPNRTQVIIINKFKINIYFIININKNNKYQGNNKLFIIYKKVRGHTHIRVAGDTLQIFGTYTTRSKQQ